MELRTSLGVAVGGLVVILTAGVLDGLPGTINQVHVVLVLVIIVVGAAALGGRMAGATTAVLATVSFDFFHTQPLRSLSINSSTDIVTTALLLVVGLAVGGMSSWGQRGSTRAADERREIHRLRRISSLAASGAGDRAVIAAVSHELVECLHLRSAVYHSGSPAADLPIIDSGGSLDRRRYRYEADGFALDAEGVALPVHAGDAVIGSFTLVPDEPRGVSLDHRIIAAVLADQLGAVLAGPHAHRS